MDSLRSMMNSRETCLLCPSACLHFPPPYTLSLALCFSVTSKKIRKMFSIWEKNQSSCASWRSIYGSGSAAISLICCCCCQFTSFGASASGRYHAQGSPFAECVLNPLSISPPVTPRRCCNAGGSVSCLMVSWGVWLLWLQTQLGLTVLFRVL